ncbi:hypothetical protein PLICRDRAFT_411156 [Plicaturopsis crispa FD-325 SS-3]|nr:hypothetical protein PLICRDRAFT_411156 [Plicaturopsis crispa FD-325 SS-3]
MAPRTATKAAADKPPKKAKSSAGGAKKKMTAYNKFMKTELARLKESEPDIEHKDRFKMATGNWKDAKENPKNK